MVTLQGPLLDAVARENALLKRALAAEEQLSAAQQALRAERDLVGKLKREAQSAAASAVEVGYTTPYLNSIVLGGSFAHAFLWHWLH